MRFSKYLGSAAILLGAAFATGQVAAEDATYTVVIENDYVFNEDRDYSSGVEFVYVSPAIADRDGLTGRIAQWALGATSSDPVRKRIGIGQLIFTPDDTSGPGTPAGQHPYAGFLYGHYGVLAEFGENRLDSFHTQIGIVGPEAQGEELQDFFHEVFNDREAMGWDTQLDTEIAFAFTYDTARKYKLFELGRLESEIIGNAGATVGTLLTQAQVGANWRLGFDLGDDFGPIKLFPFTSAGQWDNDNWGSGYVFLGATGRAVARNLFLDGNTFTDSESVDREPFVGDLFAGFVVQAGVAQISFTYQERGKAYETQDSPHKIASANISLGL